MYNSSIGNFENWKCISQYYKNIYSNPITPRGLVLDSSSLSPPLARPLVLKSILFHINISTSVLCIGFTRSLVLHNQFCLFHVHCHKRVSIIVVACILVRCNHICMCSDFRGEFRKHHLLCYLAFDRSLRHHQHNLYYSHHFRILAC